MSEVVHCANLTEHRGTKEKMDEKEIKKNLSYVITNLKTVVIK
jgi:hypothetical protein